MVELSLSAAVVCGRDDDICVVSELDKFIPKIRIMDQSLKYGRHKFL